MGTSSFGFERQSLMTRHAARLGPRVANVASPVQSEHFLLGVLGRGRIGPCLARLGPPSPANGGNPSNHCGKPRWTVGFGKGAWHDRIDRTAAARAERT